MAESYDDATSEELREHAVGLYDVLDTPLKAVQDLAEYLNARRDQSPREERTAGDIQTAAVHLAQARQALHKAAQEWPTEAENRS